MQSNSEQLTIRYALITGFAVLLTFVSHEFMHYLTGELLGNDMLMSLNKGYPKNGSYLQDWHFSVITLAGPLWTVLQAIAIFLLLRKKNIPSLFPFLVSPVLMRWIALFVSIRTPNDEARLSRDLGLTLWTLPAIICCFLLYLLFLTIKKNRYNKSFVITTISLTLVFSSMLILFDMYL